MTDPSETFPPTDFDALRAPIVEVARVALTNPNWDGQWHQRVVCRLASWIDDQAKLLERTEEEREVERRDLERRIRRDERERLASMFEKDAETIRAFTSDGTVPIEMLAWILRLDHP